MVGDFLVIRMPNARDKRSVTARFRPIDCFLLGFESAELMVRMVFDYIVLNCRPFRTTLRAGFDVNVRQSLLSLALCLQLYQIQDCLIAPFNLDYAHNQRLERLFHSADAGRG